MHYAHIHQVPPVTVYYAADLAGCLCPSRMGS